MLLFEAHVDLDEDLKISKFQKVLSDIASIIETQGIMHYNIQPEYDQKDNKNLIHNNI